MEKAEELPAQKLKVVQDANENPAHFSNKAEIKKRLFGGSVGKTFVMKLFVNMHVGDTKNNGLLDRAWHYVGQKWSMLGLVHVGVHIGSFVVHWLADSLVWINEGWREKDAHPVLVYGEEDSEFVSNAYQDAIVDVIWKYNMKLEYSQEKCNCQTFALELLNAGKVFIHLTNETALGRFLNRMKAATALATTTAQFPSST